MNERVLKILLDYKNAGVTDSDALRPMLEHLVQNDVQMNPALKTLIYQTINSANPEVIEINMGHIQAMLIESDINLQADTWGAIKHCITNLTHVPKPAEVRQDERETKSCIAQARKVHNERLSKEANERLGIYPDRTPKIDPVKLRDTAKNFDEMSKRLSNLIEGPSLFDKGNCTRLEIAKILAYLFKDPRIKGVDIVPSVFGHYMDYISDLEISAEHRRKLAGFVLDKMDDSLRGSIFGKAISWLVDGKEFHGVKINDLSDAKPYFYNGMSPSIIIKDSLQHFMRFHYTDKEFTKNAMNILYGIACDTEVFANSFMVNAIDMFIKSMSLDGPVGYEYRRVQGILNDLLKEFNSNNIVDVKNKQIGIDMFYHVVDVLNAKIKLDYDTRKKTDN